MVQFYLLPFMPTSSFAPWLVGLGKMLGFVWDGVNDPVTGYLSDRMQTCLGRRRRLLVGAALPLGLTFRLLWSPPTSARLQASSTCSSPSC
jgi:GPH family glycoside/pentoside/hexuronide:cation symporter